jgi:NAD(P)-dependent dehydrogenase (short-subunit alcohol dehydrogenase family)
MKEFKGKVAVITGAASGIGWALAERCVREGMNVVLADIEESALAKAEKDIRAIGAATLAVPTDVSKASDVEALANKALDAFGAVHLLCNNAGVGAGLSVWESTLADWQWVLGVNLWGVIHGVHFFVPIMIRQNSDCHIVNTASSAGLMTTTRHGPYVVSKHGVVALSETLYKQLEQRGYRIGVSVLCPAFVRTSIMEAERNRPEELQNKPGEGIDMSELGIQPFLRDYKRLLDNGMPPEKVADIVFAAIRDEKFYILPDADVLQPAIQARMEDILEERNPRNIPLAMTGSLPIISRSNTIGAVPGRKERAP